MYFALINFGIKAKPAIYTVFAADNFALINFGIKAKPRYCSSY